MLRRRFLVVALLGLSTGTIPAQTPAAAAKPGPPDQTVIRMAEAIRKEVISLPQYGVFDDLRFSIKGYSVILKGFASRPTLKSGVEQVVKKVEGVESVVNNIEVLPLSNQDDEIRARTYVAIYYDSSLQRYNPNRGVPAFRSPARWALGITNDPPIGFHPIHIIVKNGNVTLTGVVNNEGDKNIAGIRANGVFGVFSVENDLMVEDDARPRKSKAVK